MDLNKSAARNIKELLQKMDCDAEFNALVSVYQSVVHDMKVIFFLFSNFPRVICQSGEARRINRHSRFFTEGPLEVLPAVAKRRKK